MDKAPESTDVSEGMGIEDYTLGRPNRAQQSPTPELYRQGWDYAAAEEAREARADLITDAIGWP